MKKYTIRKEVEVSSDEYIDYLKKSIERYDRWSVEEDKKISKYKKRILKNKLQFKRYKQRDMEELSKITKTSLTVDYVHLLIDIVGSEFILRHWDTNEEAKDLTLSQDLYDLLCSAYSIPITRLVHSCGDMKIIVLTGRRKGYVEIR